MMNLTAAPAHRGPLGMPAPNPLSMAAAGFTNTPFGSPSVHQRSPFGIQELLGLSQHAAAAVASHDHSSRPLPVHHESVAGMLPVSSYLPRSLCTPATPAHTSVASAAPPILSDPAVAPGGCPPNAFTQWRANFMSFAAASSPHAHAQNMLGSLSAASGMHPGAPGSMTPGVLGSHGGQHTDASTG